MYKRLTITFTAAERAALERLAQQDIRPVKNQVLRALVLADAPTPAPLPEADEAPW